MITDPKFTKAVDSSLIVQSETNTLQSLNDKNLRYTVINRNSNDNPKNHYFKALNFPTTASDLPTGSTISKLFPELQQLNVDKIVLINIPVSGFSESIDGRSITLSFPQSGGTVTAYSAVSIYSSTYTSDKLLKSEDSPLLGSGVAFLFCDNINKPYSGTVLNEIQESVSLSTRTTWEPDANDFLKRPAAIQYSEVKGSIISYGSDIRTNVNYAISVEKGYPNDTASPSTLGASQYVYSYDIPVGVVFLDNGVLAITHPQLVNNFPITSAFTNNDVQVTTLTNENDLKDLYLTGYTSTNNDTNVSSIEYEDINTAFKQVAVCIGMPKEFYISNNSTFPRGRILSQLNEQEGIISFDPVYVTEVGMYNALGETIGIAKLSQPVEKDYTGLVVFTVEIDM